MGKLIHYSATALIVWPVTYIDTATAIFFFKILNICLTKQGLRVAKQSLCIFQTETHYSKERPLSSSNRAYV